MNIFKICKYINKLFYLNPYKIFSNICARYNNCLVETSCKLPTSWNVETTMGSFSNPKCEDFETVTLMGGCKKPACPPPCPPPKPKCPPPCPPKCPPPCPPKCPPPCPPKCPPPCPPPCPPKCPPPCPPPKKCDPSSKADTTSTTNYKTNNCRRFKLTETQPGLSTFKSMYKVKNRYTLQTRVKISELTFSTNTKFRRQMYSKTKINTLFLNGIYKIDRSRTSRYYSTLINDQQKRFFSKKDKDPKNIDTDDEPCICKLKPVEPDLLCVLNIFRDMKDDEKMEIGCYYECYKNKEYHMYTNYTFYDVFDYCTQHHQPQPIHPKYGKKFP